MTKVRRSIRHFTNQLVDSELLSEILTQAGRAPSAYNMQPWKTFIVTDKKKQELTNHLIRVATDDELNKEFAERESNYLCSSEEPYLSKKHAEGRAFYTTLGIERYDYAARKTQWLKNFEFFGAPVGIFVSIDRRLNKYSWLDCGLFIQQLSQAAEDRGLGVCLQAIFKRYDTIVLEHVDIPPDQELVCGISLGYPDWNNPINQVITERDPLDQWVTYIK